MEINYKILNPNAFHLLDAMRDENRRFIFLYGGSSSSKSYSVSQCVLLKTIEEGENTLVLRKVGATIKNSIYEDFKTNAEKMGIKHLFKFQQNTIKCLSNGSKIDFSGLDDPEKIKGIANYKRVSLEELSEFTELDFKQIRKRLRGKRGQQIIGMFNPISENHWIKTSVFDREDLAIVPTSINGVDEKLTKITSKRVNQDKTVLNPKTKKEESHPSDMVILQTTYLDNFWVVGSPDGTYGYYDRQVVADFEKDRVNDYDYYRIYALGEWGSIRTGGEFFASFDSQKHQGMFRYVSGLPVHISVDDNLLPYISVTFWQFHIGEQKELRQVHEICAADPFNTVTRAAEMVKKWLNDVSYDDSVYIHGDATTKKGNTIDDEKRSFLDKFIDVINQDYNTIECVPKSNPSVSMSGEFINSIFSGSIPNLSILISESCSKSIYDYENVKKDENGAILKLRIKNKLTKQTYEEFGHLTDTMRYVCVDLLKDEYTRFSLRRKRSKTKDDDMKYYNASVNMNATARVAYVMPCYNEMFIMAIVDVGEFANIVDVSFNRSFSEEAVIDRISTFGPTYTVVECGKSFFPMVRNLRDRFDDVKSLAECSNVDQRILAYAPTVRERVRFRSDYEEFPEYFDFVNSIMDYNGSGEKEAVNFISGVCAHVVKNFFS